MLRELEIKAKLYLGIACKRLHGHFDRNSLLIVFSMLSGSREKND